MAGGADKGLSVASIFPKNENCQVNPITARTECSDGTKPLDPYAQGADYAAAARRLDIQQGIVRDDTQTQVAQTKAVVDPNAPKVPPPKLTAAGRRIQTGLDKFGKTLAAAAQAQRTADEQAGNTPGMPHAGLSAGSGAMPMYIPTETFEIAPGVQARVGGKYNTRLGFIGEGGISSMIGEDFAIDIGGSIGPRQREILIKAGWQFNENGQLKITAQELRQLQEYRFTSGTEEAWVAQHTLGATVRFKPSVEWINYLEANGFISKSDSVQLATKTWTIDTPSLFELWENQRRIAGVTIYGGSGAINFQVGKDDTIKVTLGLEHKTKDMQLSSTGNKSELRVTGGAEWRHDWRDVQEGLSTGLQVNRDSVGYNVEGDVRQQIDDNWNVSGFARQSFRPGNEMGLAGGGNDTTVGLRATYAFDAPKGPARPPLETAAADDPAGLDRFIGRDTQSTAANDNGKTRRTAANDNTSTRPAPNSKLGTLLSFMSERAPFERDQVEAYMDEKNTRKVSIDKTGLPAGSSVDALGNASLEAGLALGAMVSAVNTTLGGSAIPTSLFTINGTKLVVNVASLEPYISGSSAGNQHTLTITTTTSVVTITAYKGSVHITSVVTALNDSTPPVTTSAPSVSGTTSSGTTLSVTNNEAGTGYYLVQAAAAAAPSAATVKASGTSFTMTASVAATASITGLTANTAYKIYFVSQDRAVTPNLQTSVLSVDVTTLPGVNVAPTANNFTYGTNISSSAKTFNWKTLSSAADANGDTLSASVTANGSKGTFSISGDNVTYTPNAGQTGTDTATLQISDGNGGTKDITVTVNNIDTLAPNHIGGAESFGNFDTAGGGFSGYMDFTEAVASVTSITVSNGGSATVDSGLGTTRLNISGTAGTDPGVITITVVDAAGNSRTVTSASYGWV